MAPAAQPWPTPFGDPLLDHVPLHAQRSLTTMPGSGIMPHALQEWTVAASSLIRSDTAWMSRYSGVRTPTAVPPYAKSVSCCWIRRASSSASSPACSPLRPQEHLKPERSPSSPTASCGPGSARDRQSCRMVTAGQPRLHIAELGRGFHRPGTCHRHRSEAQNGQSTVMATEVCDASSPLVTDNARRRLLEELDRYRLQDGRFHTPRWTSTADDGWVRLIAHQAGVLVGFLGGQPAAGHISIIGTLTPGHGIGEALVSAFARRAQQAGTTSLTVAIDTEPSQRWRRRRFFERQGFVKIQGSALHFAKPLA